MFIIEIMKKHLALLEHLAEQTSSDLAEYNSISGRTLVCRKAGNRGPYYYEQEYRDGIKKLYPIGDSDSETVMSYKRQRFLRDKLSILEKDIKAVRTFLAHYQDYSNEEIDRIMPYAYKLSNCRHLLHASMPAFLSEFGQLPDVILMDERFEGIALWAAKDYKRNPFPIPPDPNIARDGTPMRSKGECMWYGDILFEGLPVRTDPELELQGKSGQWHKLYPDFQFRCFDGSYILVEHFGSWSDEQYAERCKRKIQEYLDCGFVLGDNLIATSDNYEHRTNELMINEALEKIKDRMFR